MLFKINLSVLKQTRAVVNQFGFCFLHGDGNMYVKQDESDFRQKFSNPKNEAATYRIKFLKGDKIPETIEEINDMLLKARNQEIVQSSIPKEVSAVTTFRVEDEPAGESKGDKSKK